MPAGNEALRIELRGLREAQKATEDNIRNLRGGPVLQAFRNATMLVEGDAKRLAGDRVDTGRFLTSITPHVAETVGGIRGTVGSNLVYAPFVELDTRPHWPPISAILAWVQRKGLAKVGSGSHSITTRKRISRRTILQGEERRIAYLIARRISRKGTKGIHALENALKKNESRIYQMILSGVDKALGA